MILLTIIKYFIDLLGEIAVVLFVQGHLRMEPEEPGIKPFSLEFAAGLVSLDQQLHVLCPAFTVR